MAVLAGFAPAAVITSSINGEVFNSQGFENDTVGSAPSTANPGSYAQGTYNPPVVQQTPTPITAYQGSKYLEISETSGNAGIVMGMRDGSGEAVGQSSGTLEANLAMYLTNNADGDMTMASWNHDFNGSESWAVTWFGFIRADQAVTQLGLSDVGLGNAVAVGVNYNGSAWEYSTTGSGSGYLTAPLEQWFELNLDLDLTNSPDDATHTATVNGTTSDVMSRWARGQDHAVNALQVNHNAYTPGNTSYIDSIPEPATLGLLGAGAVGLLLRRRSRQA